MNAVHVRTTGFYCPACPLVVEKAIGSLPGVAHVMAVRSMGLTSIMYDPATVTPDVLCARIRAAGFGAEVYVAPAGGTTADEEGDARESLG